MNRQLVYGNLGVVSGVIEIPSRSFEYGIRVIANANYIAHHYCANDPSKTGSVA